MSSFICEQCKTSIMDKDLKPHPRNERKDFIRILAEFSRTENPVTKSVRRDILKHRIDNNDLG